MICRFWRGWTTKSLADAYEQLLCRIVVPNIEARNISGFCRIDMMRHDLEDEVEFATIMWFDGYDAVRAFAGPDHERAHVPASARALLSRFDERAAHYEVLESKVQ